MCHNSNSPRNCIFEKWPSASFQAFESLETCQNDEQKFLPMFLIQPLYQQWMSVPSYVFLTLNEKRDVKAESSSDDSKGFKSSVNVIFNAVFEISNVFQNLRTRDPPDPILLCDSILRRLQLPLFLLRELGIS